MTPDVAAAVRALLATGVDVQSSKEIASHAASVCQLVSQHFARLIGELGMRAMFDRSIYLAGASAPCLRTATPKAHGPYEALRQCLEPEPPDVAMEAAVRALSTFIELLERFIGEGLVASLLHEVWPVIFPSAAPKETK